MKPIFSFQKRKFEGFSYKSQHKKCCELLFALWENDSEALRKEYHKICLWMGLEPLSTFSYEHISNRFHLHKKEAGLSFKEHSLLPTVKKGDQKKGRDPLPIAIFLDRLRSAHNIGSIIRTTEAFRLGSIYFSEGSASLSHKQVQNAAMGTQSWVSLYENASLDALPKPIIALETIPEAPHVFEFQFPDSFTLAIGNEETGLSQEVLASAHAHIQIPLYGRKNSLNVACAFAIVANEIAKQKHLQKAFA